MDAKALAKSKRSHSQHHSKKPHPNQTSKASLIAATVAGNVKKPPGKQTGEKTHKFHGSASALPSNWDRYEEELDFGSDDLSHNSESRAGDAIVPKSKGADFGHLISEAQSQLQSQSLPNSESFASFDDVLPDFNQGVSSMLSVRGKSILSWIGDDNFIVEDIETASYETSFLSMDLHALAEQLSKVDLSRRLFIEADLLPPELCAKGLKEISSQEPVQVEKTREREAAKHLSDKLVFHGCADGEEIVDQKSKVTSFITTDSDCLPSEGGKLVDPVKDKSRRLDQTDTSKVAEPIARLNLNSVVDSKQKPLRFQAAAAEEELDMLLDSFSETNFLDSSGFAEKPSDRSSVVQREYTTSLLEGLPSTYTGPQPLRQGSDSSKSVPMSLNLNDAIDDLLSETSIPSNQTEAARPQEEKAVPHGLLSNTSPSRSGLNSQVLDDFDSWLDTI